MTNQSDLQQKAQTHYATRTSLVVHKLGCDEAHLHEPPKCCDADCHCRRATPPVEAEVRPLTDEEIALWRSASSHPSSSADFTRSLIATIDARDERIRELERALAGTFNRDLDARLAAADAERDAIRDAIDRLDVLSENLSSDHGADGTVTGAIATAVLKQQAAANAALIAERDALLRKLDAAITRLQAELDRNCHLNDYDRHDLWLRDIIKDLNA
jgi:hypothetical protein